MTSTTNNNDQDNDAGDDIERLLPWYVNGTLPEQEHARVAAFAERSPQFAQQLAAELRLRDAVRFSSLDTDARWETMRAQITPEQDRRPHAVTPLPARPRHNRPFAGVHWSARETWAMAAQFLVLVACAATLLTVLNRDNFVLLGRSDPANSPAGNVLVMFHPATTQAATQAVLRENGLQIVRGPTETGAYVATVDVADRPQTLSRLRRHSSVMMAEAIDQSPTQ